MPLLCSTTLRVGDHDSCCISTLIKYGDYLESLSPAPAAVGKATRVPCDCGLVLGVEGYRWVRIPEGE